MDIIQDFSCQGPGKAAWLIELLSRLLPEILAEGTPKASDPDGTDGIFTITTGSVSQTVSLRGDDFNEDDEMDDIIGDDGTGSPFLIFE